MVLLVELCFPQRSRFPLTPFPWLLGIALAGLGVLGSGTEAVALPELGVAPVLAQATQTPLQGDRVTVNGMAFRLNWMQWPDPKRSVLRTGVSDFGLAQAIGLELLNTEDVTKQPIQWFSQPAATPIILPTRRSATQRYLDLTDLAQLRGWQVQTRGSTLQIVTPVAKLMALRQGKQFQGDRLVLELDRPTPWQVDQQGQDVTLTLNVQADPSLSQFQPKLTDSLPALQWEPTPARLRFKLGNGQRLRVWSLPNPDRLIVDIRPDGPPDQNILWAPGLRWRRQTVTLGNNRFPVVWLEVNLRQSRVAVKPILPNLKALVGTAPLAQTAQLNQVTAAINGGFFNRNNQLALGAVLQDNRWFSGPILNRGAIAWDSDGKMQFDRLTLEEAIVTNSGQRLPITHLNSAYILPGIARYTPTWGQSYTVLGDGEVAIAVQAGRVTSQQPVSLGTQVAIPTGGYLLIARSNPAVLGSLAIGSALRINSAPIPTEFQFYPQILAAGPLLLKNKQIVLDARAEGFGTAFASERASRSAVGRNPAGTLMLVAVHDRLQGPGPSLTEMAQIMQQLGAIDALNLDGGSSTTLYLGGQMVDRSPRSAARVHNGIGVFVQPNP
jgi:Phosphodiester glycosidase